MLKTLLKKQFRELGQTLFPNRKKDKSGNIKKTSRALYIVIYAIALVSLTVSFAGLAFSLSGFLAPEVGLSSLYFTFIGLVGILFGVFGSVFSTYSSLYLAKDNDTLLAMPIPPAFLLFVRMLTVFTVGAVYILPVWVPGMVVYAITLGFSPVAFLCQFAVYLLLCVFVCFLSALLGFLVAVIASRLKNKSVAVVVLSLAFFVLYYIACFRAGEAISAILFHAAEIGAFVAAYLHFLNWMGAASCADGLSLLIFAGIVLALFALLYWVLSKTFIAVSTRKVGEKKAVYHEKAVQKGSVSSALFKKERRRFVRSATYLLNSGIGIILIPIAVVVLAIKSSEILPVLEAFGYSYLLPILIYVLPAFMLGMNAVSAPSISLEGKTIWQLQSLPIKPWQILRAKLLLHMAINAPFCLFCSVFLGVWFGVDPLTILTGSLCALSVVLLSALWGLFWGLKKPTMDWTNETYPIKQSAPVTFTVLGAMLLSVVTTALCAFLLFYLHPALCYACLLILLLIPCILLFRWLKTKGPALFAAL